MQKFSSTNRERESRGSLPKRKTGNIVLVLAFFLLFLGASVPKSFAITAPTDIVNLKLWLDASQGVTKDGTTPAIDGDTVQQWNDYSSGGYNATQATAGIRPIYKTTILNGKPVIRFSGTESMATASFLDNTFNTALTSFIVENKTGTAHDVNFSNQGIKWYGGRSGGDTGTLDYNASALSNGNIVIHFPNSGLQYGVETYRYNGSSVLLKFDGLLSATTASTGNLGLSGALTIGKLSTGGFPYHGDIAEIIIYNRALSDSEVSQVEQYLIDKWALDTSVISRPQIIFDGDSLTLGTGSTGGLNYPNQTITQLGGSNYYDLTNIGVGGQLMQTILANGATAVDPLYKYYRSNNYVSLLGGTNDLDSGSSDASTTYGYIVSYSQARRTAGYKVIVNTILPRGAGAQGIAFEALRQTVNSSIRANWESFADGISDIGADPIIGTFGANLNATYYTDTTHMTNAGYAILASHVAAAVNQITDPIAVSNVLVAPSAATATITWTTNQTGSTKVNFGLNSSYGSSTEETDTVTRVLSHTTSLSNLLACTTYHFQVVSSDLNGNQVLSTDQSFTTTGCIPTIPTNLSVVTSANSIDLTVDSFPEDTIGQSGYYFSNSTKGTNSDWIQINTWTDSGLSCGTTYICFVKYRNRDGVENDPISITATTNGCPSSSGSRATRRVVIPTPASIATSNPSPNSGPSTYNFGPTVLKLKSRGEAVKELQRFFNAKLNSNLIIDGIFGPKTLAVVKQWQKDNGLVVDGLVGPKTKGKMNATP